VSISPGFTAGPVVPPAQVIHRAEDDPVSKLGKFAARSQGWQHRLRPGPQWLRPSGEEQGCHPGTPSRGPRTYILAVVVEPVEGAWHAYCPTLLDCGAATWGTSREEALGHVRDMVTMVLEHMTEQEVSVLAVPADLAPAPAGQVVVTVSVPTA
jgi:predicted RNase H-like HicB family nuclease